MQIKVKEIDVCRISITNTKEDIVNLLANIARVCTGRTNVDDFNLNFQENLRTVRSLMNKKHLSIFRHVPFLIKVESKSMYNRLCKRDYFTGKGNLTVSANYQAWYDVANKIQDKFIQETEMKIKLYLTSNCEFEFYKDINIDTNHQIYYVKSSRASFAQQTRHPRLHVTAESQRYNNYVKRGYIEIINPTSLFKDDDVSITVNNKKTAIHDIIQQAEQAANVYEKIINRGCKPEVARQVLPQCTAVQYFLSGLKEDLNYVTELRTKPDVEQPTFDINKIIKELSNYQECNCCNNKEKHCCKCKAQNNLDTVLKNIFPDHFPSNRTVQDQLENHSLTPDEYFKSINKNKTNKSNNAKEDVDNITLEDVLPEDLCKIIVTQLSSLNELTKDSTSKTPDGESKYKQKDNGDSKQATCTIHTYPNVLDEILKEKKHHDDTKSNFNQLKDSLNGLIEEMEQVNKQDKPVVDPIDKTAEKIFDILNKILFV